MALEWVVLTYAALAEALMVLLLTIPGDFNPLRKGLLTVTRNLLKPFSSIVPFCMFLLMDIYWKYEHMPSSCGGGGEDGDNSNCGPVEYLRYEKSVMKTQRNFLLVMAALVFYWVLRAVTGLVQREEEMNQRIKMLKKRAD